MSATSGAGNFSGDQSVSLNKAAAMNTNSSAIKKFQAAPLATSGNTYLDSLNQNTYEMNYDKFAQKAAIHYNTMGVNTQIHEATNMAKANVNQTAAAAPVKEEVTFTIEKMEDKPAVITNHFAGDVTESTERSTVTKAVQGTWGQLLTNAYNAFNGVNTQAIKGPTFAAIFAMLCFTIPTPAFAATAASVTAAGASAVAQSNMTKLLKSVVCAGLAAVITVSFIHPIDVVKTRMQVADKSESGLGQVIGGAIKNEGVGAFYKGIGPAWLREASYTSLRLGLYEPIKILVGATAGAGFFRKFLAGALAGAIGSLAGNPFDVLKTRMMADKTSSKGLGQIAGEIVKMEGILGLYKGFNVNVMRAMVLNATKMACYDTVKAFIVASFAVEGILLQFMAAFVAGFIMTCTVAPFDMCRTLVMNQKPDENGKMPYKGLLDCAMSIIKKDGPTGFYKGFFPIWSRFAPTTVLQLIIYEQLKKIPALAI